MTRRSQTPHIDTMPNLKLAPIFHQLIHHRRITSSPNLRIRVSLLEVGIAASMVVMVMGGDTSQYFREAGRGGGLLDCGEGVRVYEYAGRGGGVDDYVGVVVVADWDGDDLHGEAGKEGEETAVGFKSAIVILFC